MAGTSVYLNEEAAILADLLVDHVRQDPRQIGQINRSAVLQAALWVLAESWGLDVDKLRAEVGRRMAG